MKSSDILKFKREILKSDPRIMDRMENDLPKPDLDYVKETVLEMTGVSLGTYYNTLKWSTAKPNFYVLLALCQILSCTVDEVMDRYYHFHPLRKMKQVKTAAKYGLTSSTALAQERRY